MAVTTAGSLRTGFCLQRGEHHDPERFSLCVFNINLNQTYATIDGFSIEYLLV